MKKLSEVLVKPKIQKNQTTEFQIYGTYLSESLDDLAHIALYIKLAKTKDRGQLEAALSFVKGVYNPKSKAKLFMWKLKQIKDEKI